MIKQIFFFPTNNPKSRVIADMLHLELKKNMSGCELHDLGYPVSPDTIHYVFAEGDIVIIDATVELDGNDNYCIVPNVYFDHALIISRTYLPENYAVLWEGGSPRYPNSFTNKQIVDWLAVQVIKLWQEPNKHRKALSDKHLGIVNGEAFETYLKRLREKRSIFISYRSKRPENGALSRSKHKCSIMMVA